MATVHTSTYSMLMTVLFYTIASLCALRAAAWLSVNALLPVLSCLLSYCCPYYHRRSHADDTAHRILSSSSLLSADPANEAPGTTLFKLVRTAAGHVLFVPVSTAGQEPQEADTLSTAASKSFFRRNAMLGFWLGFFGTVLITYYYPYYVTAVINNARRSQRGGGNRPGLAMPPEPNSNAPRTPPSPTRAEAAAAAAVALAQKGSLDDSGAALAFTKTRTKTRLNPAAPVFTPSLAHRRLLDPTAHPFTPAPASPADSPGPATPPSTMRGAFTFAIAARAAHRYKGGIDGSPLPLGAGKTRVVQPEDVLVRERRADEVFVFF